MVLEANDFGCLPEGRVFERVTTQVGVPVVAVADGTLRASDVGKLISIPGATDLVTEISALIGRKDATQASMALDSTTLTAIFPSPPGDRFEAKFSSADPGKRILVTGAGADGGDLVTFVVGVHDGGMELELAHPAQTAVNGVLAVLNRPDRVQVADYARATPAADSAVVFDDRTITDATMVLGQVVLRSSTAQFSFADLGTPVTVLGAGTLVTTIIDVNCQAEAVMEDAPQYVVTDGPADVWMPAPAGGGVDLADSRPPFASLLATLQEESTDIEAAEIVFGPGVYDFTKVPGASIELHGVRNLTVRGAGAGATVLRLRPGQAVSHDAHVIRFTDCKNVTLRDLSVHGSYLTMATIDEQMHGVFISAGCEEIVVERVRVFQTAGDGIRLVGEPPHDVSKVWINNCRIIQNKRSGIAVQRNVERVWVRNCYIDMTAPSNDSCIDFEPTGQSTTGHTAPRDITIDGNVLEHGNDAVAVSLSGMDVNRPAERLAFTNNSLRGGDIGGVHARDVTVASNIVRGSGDGPVMRFQGRYDGLHVVSNRISAEADSEASGIHVGARTVSPSDIRIEQNDIDVPGIGVALERVGSSIAVRANRIRGQGTSAGIAIDFTSGSGAHHRDLMIAGNTIENIGGAGIDLNRGESADTVDGLDVSANHIFVADSGASDQLVGIQLGSTNSHPWAVGAVVSGNRIGVNVQTPIVRGQGVPNVITGGNAAGPAVYEGDGTPDSLVAPAGSLYIRVDTDPAELHLRLNATAWARVETEPTL